MPDIAIRAVDLAAVDVVDVDRCPQYLLVVDATLGEVQRQFEVDVEYIRF